MSNFEETMTNSRIFFTYSLAMTMLGKSSQILAERGADPKAMSFITTGIELLAKQLRDFADGQDLLAEAKGYVEQPVPDQRTSPLLDQSEILLEAEIEVMKLLQSLGLWRRKL